MTPSRCARRRSGHVFDELATDSEPDGDPLTVTGASATNGTVVINPDGTLTYTPNANFNGTDTVTYTISDGQGGTSIASVAVTVVPVNDPPVAANDTASTNEDVPITIGVLGNDTDLDGDSLTVTAAAASNGTVTINPDGTIGYTPGANINGDDTAREAAERLPEADGVEVLVGGVTDERHGFLDA